MFVCAVRASDRCRSRDLLVVHVVVQQQQQQHLEFSHIVGALSFSIRIFSSLVHSPFSFCCSGSIHLFYVTQFIEY